MKNPEALQHIANDLDVSLRIIDPPVCRMDHADPFFRYGKVVHEIGFGLL
jgi:hypothetical protein